MATSKTAGLLAALAAVVASACGQGDAAVAATAPAPKSARPAGPTATATFAGGCFWCVESGFEGVDGIVDVVSGYSGGTTPDPTYEQVSSGRTGHAEAIEVRYDPRIIGYRALLDVFWRQIDPTDAGGQFADRGSQYRTAIFYHDAEQQRIAEESKAALGKSGKFSAPIVTEIVPAGPFYRAEEYHQNFHAKQPDYYERYRRGSGRAGYIEEVWGSTPRPAAPEEKKKESAVMKPTDEDLKQRLTPLQYEVTQHEGTERAFDNPYWDNHAEGIYVDLVSGEPLFSSLDKYDSGTGWPSFTRPIEPANVVERTDYKMIVPRTEVRSKAGNSHLGHLFDDGPGPTGQRYCMNSAALRFIPKEDLEKEGYGAYRKLFEKPAK